MNWIFFSWGKKALCSTLFASFLLFMAELDQINLMFHNSSFIFILFYLAFAFCLFVLSKNKSGTVSGQFSNILGFLKKDFSSAYNVTHFYLPPLHSSPSCSSGFRRGIHVCLFWHVNKNKTRPVL